MSAGLPLYDALSPRLLTLMPNRIVFRARSTASPPIREVSAQEVAQRLFKGFMGTLHSDFDAVYWTLSGITHAPCWGHLCRRTRQIAERQPESDEAARFHDRLSGLYGWGVAAQGTSEVVVVRGSVVDFGADGDGPLIALGFSHPGHESHTD